MSEKKRCNFFCDNFKYEGYILEETLTHFIIQDSIKGKKIYLPKSITKIEVLEQ